jgi:hypothetical protein
MATIINSAPNKEAALVILIRLTNAAGEARVLPRLKNVATRLPI